MALSPPPTEIDRMADNGATSPLARASGKDGCPMLCRPPPSRPTPWQAADAIEAALDRHRAASSADVRDQRHAGARR
jgi:hypothetical protein